MREFIVLVAPHLKKVDVDDLNATSALLLKSCCINVT